MVGLVLMGLGLILICPLFLGLALGWASDLV
jgi:hypothetical protein